MGLNSSCCQDEDPPNEVIQPEVLHCGAKAEDDHLEHGGKCKDQEPVARDAHDGGREAQPPSKTSRLQKMRHLFVDKEIVRGIDLRKTLLRGGKLWRCSPVDLPLEQREQLWHQSKPVEGFDTFLSHTWLTPGKWKILALSMQSSWKIALACWALSSSLAMLLSGLDILPTPGTQKPDVAGFRTECPLGAWIIAFGFLGTTLGFFFSVCILGRWGSSGVCFFDVVTWPWLSLSQFFGNT